MPALAEAAAGLAAGTMATAQSAFEKRERAAEEVFFRQARNPALDGCWQTLRQRPRLLGLAQAPQRRVVLPPAAVLPAGTRLCCRRRGCLCSNAWRS